ncbi:MAG: SiaB family protein kinase [Bacteroidales bacterium]
MNFNEKATSFQDFVYGFYELIREHQITLVYEGEVTHQLTKEFTSLTENTMIKNEESSIVQRNVFHVMVECLQNISRHADNVSSEGNTFSGRGIFIVSRDANEYYVTTGNMIDRKRTEEMKKMLDTINSLDKDGLTNLYKTQIKKGSISEKGGAGLGLIDMARKTGNKFVYRFIDINDQFSFFILTSIINRI